MTSSLFVPPPRRPSAPRSSATRPGPGLRLLAVLAGAVLASVLFAPRPVSAQLPGLKGGATPTLAAPDHVRAFLEADQAVIAPGTTFRLGIRYAIERDWHIYWDNSGEAGFRTSVAFELPDGFEVGPLQWPAPLRFLEAGDIMTYGYKDSVVLWAEVTPPADLAAGSEVEVRATTDWLMCKETCIPGDATLSLRLRTGDAPEPSPRAGRFDEAARRTPRPLALDVATGGAASPPLGVAVAADGPRRGRVVLGAPADPAWEGAALQAAYRTLTFFPANGPLFLNQRSRARLADGGGFTVEVSTSRALQAGDTIEGVLVVPREGRDDAEPDGAFTAHALSVTVTEAMLAAGAGEVAPIAPDAPAAATNGADSATAAGSLGTLLDGDFREASSGWVARLGLVGQLLLAFIGGLILNIMPCVLPVISLKVLGLVRQGGEDPRRILRLGLVFTLGIWGSFMALAVPIAVLVGAGRLVGWGEMFQSPWFLFAIYGVLVVFGLSLLGVYEVRLPGAAADRLQGAARREGYAGSFFNGCLATVLATPCMAPFIGPAIGFAVTQPPVMILVFFSMIALGLAAPYLLLAMRPGWMKWLPKPGDWMENVKLLMGLAMIGAAVYPFHVLVERAANIDGAGTRIDAFATRLLLFTTFLTLAIILMGRFVTMLTSTRRAVIIYTVSIGLVALSYAAFLRAPMQWMVAGELPDDRIVWVDFSPDALEAELAAGNVVFLDFTAEWCITCKFNEAYVLDTTRVRAELNRDGVVAMKADWTRRNPEITAVLSRFGRAGVPFYVVFSPSNPGQPNALGETITPGQVIEALRAARS